MPCIARMSHRVILYYAQQSGRYTVWVRCQKKKKKLINISTYIIYSKDDVRVCIRFSIYFINAQRIYIIVFFSLQLSAQRYWNGSKNGSTGFPGDSTLVPIHADAALLACNFISPQGRFARITTILSLNTLIDT